MGKLHIRSRTFYMLQCAWVKVKVVNIGLLNHYKLFGVLW